MTGEVRIGRPLGFFRAQNGALAVTNCGSIPPEMWEALEDFQRPLPPLPPNFPARLVAEALRETPMWNEVPWAKEIERKMQLNPNRSVVWDFLALDKPGEGVNIMSAVLGEERIVPWTWLDAHFHHPILVGIAKTYNFFGRLVGKIR